MTEREQKHFAETQRTERINIKSLFVNHFQKHNCSQLNLTSEGDHSSIDAIMLSATTKSVAIEYKRRKGKLPLTSAIIELKKYENEYFGKCWPPISVMDLGHYFGNDVGHLPCISFDVSKVFNFG